MTYEVQDCPKLDYYSLAAFWKKPVEPTVSILTNVIDKGGVYSLIGKSKLGKSIFALQTMLNVAGGKDIFGFEVPEPRKVVYFDCEVSEPELIRRTKELSFDPDALLFDEINLSESNFFIVPMRNTLVDIESAKAQMVEIIKKVEADVVVIDPIYALFDGNENCSEHVKYFCNQLRQIVSETGVALIFVHHDTKGYAGDKDSVDRGAGSNVLGRFVDGGLNLTRHSSDSKLVVVDGFGRSYADFEPFTIEQRGKKFVLSDEEPEKQTKRSSQSQRITARQELEMANKALKVIAERVKAEHKGWTTAKVSDYVRDKFSLTQKNGKRVMEAIFESVDAGECTLPVRVEKTGNQRYEIQYSPEAAGPSVDLGVTLE